MSGQIKPPMIYFGGKQRIAGRIAALLPGHGHYVEPYFGSGTVLLAKPRSDHETVNDIDGDLMNFWQVLRDRPLELIRLCALTPHGRAEFHAAAEPSPDPLEQARRTWIRVSQGRSGANPGTGWRNYVDPAGSHSSMPDYIGAYVNRMAAVAERMHAVSLECRPALDLLAEYDRAGVLFYVDPPYLASTRNERKRYRFEMGTELEHRELAKALHGLERATAVLSGYPSALYDDELYPDWQRATIRAHTGHAGPGEQARTEVLWSNRAFPSTLF